MGIRGQYQLHRRLELHRKATRFGLSVARRSKESWYTSEQPSTNQVSYQLPQSSKASGLSVGEGPDSPFSNSSFPRLPFPDSSISHFAVGIDGENTASCHHYGDIGTGESVPRCQSCRVNQLAVHQSRQPAGTVAIAAAHKRSQSFWVNQLASKPTNRLEL